MCYKLKHDNIVKILELEANESLLILLDSSDLIPILLYSLPSNHMFMQNYLKKLLNLLMKF